MTYFIIYFHTFIFITMQKYDSIQLIYYLDMFKKNFFLMFLAVSIIVGYTYSLNTPQALQIALRKEPYKFTTISFNLIYFGTYLLSAIFSIPLGIILDRFPIKITLMVLLILLFLAQVLISLTFQFLPQGYQGIIVFLRGVFGISGQGLYVLQGAILPIYAKTQYQLLGGLGMTLPFVFSAFNSLITTAVYDATNKVPLPWYIGCGVALFSLLCGVWMCKTILNWQKQQNSSQKPDSQNNNQPIAGINPEVHQIAVQEDKNKKCRTLRSFNIKFWIFIVFIFFGEACLSPFLGNLNQYMVQRFNFSYIDTGKILIIPELGLPIFAFINGWILRKKPNYRRKIVLMAAILYFCSHVGLYLLPNTQNPEAFHYAVVILFLLFMSVKYAVYYCSIVPSPTYFIQKKYLGITWGIIGSSLTLSQSMVPLMQMKIIESDQDLSLSYKMLSIAISALSLVSLIFAIFINFWDYSELDGYYKEISNSKKLNKTSLPNIGPLSDGLALQNSTAQIK